MRSGFVVAFLAAVASEAAAQQDTIKFNTPNRQDMTGEITAMSIKTVDIDIEAGNTRVSQKVNTREIREVVIDQNRKGFDFASGEDAMNRGEFAQAAERFARVKADQRAPDVVRQMAAINLVKAHYAAAEFPASLAALAALRKERPDSFFLRDTYEFEYRCHLARNDVNAMAKTVAEFDARAQAENLPEWRKSAEVMQGQLHEFQGKWDAALAIHRKYARDRDVGDEAALGEFRCLRQLAQWTTLRSRGEGIIMELRGKKGVNERLLTGAYNARGEAHLNGGQLKEALLDFLQGVLVLNKTGESNREHEMSIGRAALACARLAAAEKDAARKNTYKERADELVRELDKVYANSPLRADVIKAIQAIK